MCSIADLDGIGPFSSNPQCGHLSFTLLFEEAVLAAVPLGLCVVLALLRVRQLRLQSPKARRDRLYYAKLTALFLLASVQLVQLIQWTRPSTPKTRASIAIAAVSFASTIVFIGLCHLEHIRSAKPSDLLTLYFVTCIAFDIIRTRTLWIVSGGTAVASTFTVGLVLRLLFALLESRPKTRALQRQYLRESPEARTSLINRLFFWWVNPLLWTGFKRILDPGHLFNLDRHISSSHLFHVSAQRLNDTDLSKSYAVLLLCLREYKWTFLAGVLPRLALTGFTFAQPFLVTRFLSYESNRDARDAGATGTWLIVAYAGVYIGIAISQAGYIHQTFRFITMVRGSLLTLLYHDTMNKGSSAGIDPTSAELTLVSADIEKIQMGLQTMHQAWASFVDICLATWLLERHLGLATIPSVGFSLLCVVFGGGVAVMAGSRQTLWLEAIQKRLGLTSDVINMFKSVKMTALVNISAARVLELRDKEITVSKKFRRCLVFMVSLTYLSNVFAPIIGFTTYTLAPAIHKNNILDSARAFSSLTIFALLTEGVGSFVHSAVNLMLAVSSFERYRTTLLEKHTWHESKKASRRWTLTAPPLLENTDAEQWALEVLAATADAHTPPDDKQVCIQARDTNIGWSSEKIVVQSLSLVVRKREITLVTGPTNSGKSTLLRAMLGEAWIEGPALHRHFDRAAYCDQIPWLANKTIRQNILGGSPVDEDWYETTLQACQLKPDLGRLAQGDQTVVGNEGSRLSGGQRTRVALARAVYSRLDIMLLDDITSGLDPNTTKSIVEALFGKDGLFRRAGQTVVVASNNASFLSLADQVVDLGSGSPKVTRRNVESSSPVTAHVHNQTSPKGSRIDSARGSLDEISVADFRLEEPKREPRRLDSDTSIYMYYVRTVGVVNTAVFLALCMALVFAMVFPSIWVAWWVEANARGETNQLAKYLLVYFFLGVAALIALIGGGSHLMLRMVPRSARILHRALLDAVVVAPVPFMTRNDAGETLNRFSQDLEIIDTDVPLSGFTTLFAFITCIAQAIVVCVSSPFVTAGMVPTLVLVYFIQKFYLRTSPQLRALDLEAKAPLIGHMQETLRGLATIRAFGWAEDYEERNMRLVDESQKPFYQLTCIQRWLGLVLDLVVAGIAILLAIVIVSDKNGGATSGFLGIALTSLVSFGLNLGGFIGGWTGLETALTAVARVKRFSADTAKEDLPEECQTPPTDWPQRGEIVFDDVTASYGPGTTDVLSNVSFRISPGEKIGIIGRTGSGKSSLVSTLSRTLDLISGSILIDSIPLSSLPRDTVRQALINMPQDAFVLHGSIRTNVDPRSRLTDEAITEVLTELGLWPILAPLGGLDADAVSALPAQGLKQLLCFARVLAQPGRVMVLDEATSRLDPEASAKVKQAIMRRSEGRTLLTVAHKIDELDGYDRIMVVDAGKVVAFDTPGAVQGYLSSSSPTSSPTCSSSAAALSSGAHRVAAVGVLGTEAGRA
ncbi:hypothetical protein ANO11243_029910 [Dothideomycetidae sp. 11243]|uniref:ABC-type transporter frbG n=1 Tax=Dothideomycetidae sp. (strain 11243) TaxID=1603295 RepID=FRBG_DOTX1|nr:RecName: Full=ABC-type transporter frbG; AltName: Full=FR901469 biosynthesis cluster protein G [fungal sp. No.11243]GAM84988.1 hypothetical protein ANO11243_029910 [fungal sp. No.11243]